MLFKKAIIHEASRLLDFYFKVLKMGGNLVKPYALCIGSSLILVHAYDGELSGQLPQRLQQQYQNGEHAKSCSLP